MAKSKKITNTMRHSILNKAMDWKFGKEEEELRRREGDVAMEVFQALFPPEVQALINALPAWLAPVPKDENEISFVGEVLDALDPDKERALGDRWYGRSLRFPEGVVVRRPHFANRSDEAPAETFAGVTEEVKRNLLDYLEAKATLKERKGNFRAKLSDLLAGVGTTAKLTDVLPEAAEWIPEVYHCSDMPQADKVAEILTI